MSNVKDLTGMKFGSLKVISPTAGKDCNRHVMWTCKCDCGNTVEIASSNLICGRTKTCGHCFEFKHKKESAKPLIIYIAGPITGVWNYKANFAAAEFKLRGNIVFNPSLLPEGLPHEAYMPICYAMMDACDTVYFLQGWKRSQGARMELKYANEKKMRIEFEGSKNNEN